MTAKTFSVTLTYGGGDHERAAVLTYSDVQKYFKRLRKAGYKFKYLVSGEYGSTKGRAHWHAILFFEDEAPPHVLKQNFADKFWHHGHVWYEEPTPKAVRYVCKYIQKDQEDAEWQGHFAMSKKPPIGHSYFMRMADKLVEQGLSPRDLRYHFAENLDREGKPVKHMMQGAIARDFLDRFITRWVEVNGHNNWPNSELVDEHIDKKAGLVPTLKMEPRIIGVKPCWLPRRDAKLEFSEAANCFYCDVEGTRYWWRTKDGDWSWQSVVGPADREAETSFELNEDLQRSREWRRLDKLQETASAAATPAASAKVSTSRPKRRRARNLPMVGERYVPRY